MVRSLTGLTARRIRYYEKRGLLGDVARSEANQRQYTRLQVAQLREIASFLEQGFSLPQIKVLLDPSADAQDLDQWAGELEQEAGMVLQRAHLFRRAADERRSLAS